MRPEGFREAHRLQHESLNSSKKVTRIRLVVLLVAITAPQTRPLFFSRASSR